MRLSASLQGLPVGVGVVDCERPTNVVFCRTTHGMPERPHAPEFKAWPRGTKPAGRGQALFDASTLEAHKALELVDSGLRLALHHERDGAFDDEGAESFGADAPAPGPAAQRPPGGGGVRWDGPARPDPNAKPLPWANQRPDVAAQRLR